MPEGLLRKPLHRPLVQRNGADGAVDSQGGFVPVEADPLHATAMAFQGKMAQVFEHGLAIAPSALFGEDEEVLQVESLPPQEGGEVVKEKGKADNFAVFFAQDDLGGTLHEQGMAERRRVSDNLAGTFFIVGQSLDEVKDDTLFARPGGSDCKGW